MLEKFQTETETILEIWSQAMAESLNQPKYSLDAKYLDRFFAEVSELGMNRIPAWVLRKTALRCVTEVKDGHRLSLGIWKEEARLELLKEKDGDIVTDTNGTTWVVEGSLTDIGRKLIGSVQNYSDDN